MSEEFQWPNDEIRHIGISLLSEFQDHLYQNIEKILLPIHGDEWFEKCINKDKWQFKSYGKDLYTLLREIVEFTNHNFRIAISKSIFDKNAMTKSELNQLANILSLRNRWAHEPTDFARRISSQELHALAKSVLVFASSDSLRISCNNILNLSSLTELLFSMPAIARNLPNNMKTYKQLESISKIFEEFKNNQDSHFNIAITAQHAFTRTFDQWNLLLLKYRLMQARILNKVHVDSYKLMVELRDSDKDLVMYSKNESNETLSDFIKKLIEELIPIEENLLAQIDLDLKELELTKEKRSSELGEGICACDACKIFPGFMGALYEDDERLDKFLEDRIYNSALGVKFLQLSSRSTEIEDADT